MSADELEAFQFYELKNTLTLAYQKIPFYRRLYDSHGLGPHDFNCLKDIEKFPTITKSDVKNNLEDLINKSIPKSRWLVTTTGGSTAEPMRFYQLKGVTRVKEKASIGAGWRRVGFNFGDRAIQIKGRPVADPAKKIFWQYEPIQNYLEMDSSHMTQENMPLYIEQIEKFKAKYLIGFPSSLYILAKYIHENNLTPPVFNAVLLASENVYPWQRKFLQDIFKCRIYSHYGHSEMILLGMEEGSSTDLLFFPHYGYAELLDQEGNSLHTPGATGELVGTSFHNPVMPFIRYRTQDIGTLSASTNKIPRALRLSHVSGRKQEFMITGSSRLVSVCTMGAAHFDTMDNVLQMQYVQNDPGIVELHLVVNRNFSTSDEAKIFRSVIDILGRDTELVIRKVGEMKRTPAGKHMMLVQNIKNVAFYGNATV